MNRTDRLYAIVEELRASAPRRRTARELARRYEVSVRTIERDIAALQQAGVPIYADVGRRGGYTIDKAMTLPPLNFTPAEAVAVAVALGRFEGAPFAEASRSALAKIVGAMPERDAAAARELAGRVRLMRRADAEPARIPPPIEQAVLARRVLRIRYEDRDGVTTEREVEPIVVTGGPFGWYLIGWCRLREDTRVFRLDRIRHAVLTGLPAPARRYEDSVSDLPGHLALVPAL
ncbi:Predicted DNA-binding transcriptional regulator YafY, contains an HTH and WYL domains [Thermomonospora echinospora]|uniref:Predicted DNA-binding transcriptional regulator YafY, contains an HTH and WYL domains n=1 Tax=Thermomonospora echinospora TaxID=1992 RepID=A0A1H5XSC0_9ACTN|nr:YafY family protein [Thermomonospora echinospora]SEG14156.1 Predicted DNA-binding transcriptional regulator YafY, contains an HTH and WYL domains [Thermomonospora echinospora]